MYIAHGVLYTTMIPIVVRNQTVRLPQLSYRIGSERQHTSIVLHGVCL